MSGHSTRYVTHSTSLASILRAPEQHLTLPIWRANFPFISANRRYLKDQDAAIALNQATDSWFMGPSIAHLFHHSRHNLRWHGGWITRTFPRVYMSN